MLTEVDVFGVDPSPTMLALPVSGATGLEPLQIRGVDGLTPVKADINTSAYADDDESFSGARTGKRNIVLKIGFRPNWVDQTIEGLRQEMYKYFMPKTNVRLRFQNTHLPTSEILGYVESCDPDLFSKDPVMQVSVICPKSDFVAIDATVLNGLVGDAPIDIDYDGSRNTGFQLDIHPNVAHPAFTDDLVLTLSTVSDRVFKLNHVTIDATKYFTMGSNRGEKYVRNILVPSGNVVNVLAKLDAIFKTWPALRPGLNRFDVDSPSVGQPWTLSYFSRFGGL